MIIYSLSSHHRKVIKHTEQGLFPCWPVYSTIHLATTNSIDSWRVKSCENASAFSGCYFLGKVGLERKDGESQPEGNQLVLQI